MALTDISPFPTNPQAAKVDGVINTIIQKVITTVTPIIEATIMAKYPFLEAPVIKQIVDETISILTQELGNELSKQLQEAGTFLTIDNQVATETSGVSAQLAAIMAAEKSGDKDALQKAIAEFQAAQSALVNCDGAARPST